MIRLAEPLPALPVPSADDQIQRLSAEAWRLRLEAAEARRLARLHGNEFQRLSALAKNAAALSEEYEDQARLISLTSTSKESA